MSENYGRAVTDPLEKSRKIFHDALKITTTKEFLDKGLPPFATYEQSIQRVFLIHSEKVYEDNAFHTHPVN